ncbi:MAG: glycine--tRNA ligase subunit beta [Alphaproteobacteria bacterium]|nr:glycine--tRNA ligase subunit beta [Alphaproteobacteria bacterium]
MSDLLLELYCEEIPARFQANAAGQLKSAVTGALMEAGLSYDSAAAFAGPRRLTLAVGGIPARSMDKQIERKGPRTDAPARAVEGFAKAAGLTSIADAKIVKDDKKGDYYMARSVLAGEPAAKILAGFLPGIITGFNWPKSMKWGAGDLVWVRPLRAILATLGAENDETETIRFQVGGLTSANITYGHRFLSEGPITVRRFDDYAAALEAANVVLDGERRAEIIHQEAKGLAFAAGLVLIEDKGLIGEVAGLVEWPVLLSGTFDEAFLALPDEVIIATIKANQKCFCLRDEKTGRLAPRFVIVANMVTSDNGKSVIAGNERVIRARLSDAKFFYDADLGEPLENRLPRLAEMVFHKKLGSQLERVERLKALTVEIGPTVGADIDVARRAAMLSKADLVTAMVVEFPGLQGQMGRAYALAQGEDKSVAEAIANHYRPLGPSDTVPNDPVSITVALADKIDMLTGFWAVGETPTGSKDPFALRRAALGLIRIILENRLSLSLKSLISIGRMGHLDNVPLPVAGRSYTAPDAVMTFDRKMADDLVSFFHDRLKITLRQAGAAHDIVEASISVGADDVYAISQKVTALTGFLETPDGEKLLSGYRRTANLLRDEEKKDAATYAGRYDVNAISSEVARTLANAIALSAEAVAADMDGGDFSGAMAQLSALADPVDRFFDEVRVNDPDPAVRLALLNVLAHLRATMHLVADFSKIEG